MSQSGEKTERATPKKRRDARMEGQVLKSTEVNTALSLLVMFGGLQLLAPFMGEWVERMYKSFITSSVMEAGALTQKAIGGLFLNAGTYFLVLAGPLLGIAVLVGLFTNFAQVGFLFTTKALKPKLSHISPAKGFKRIFSSRSLVELLKSIIKVTVLGVVVYNNISDNIVMLPQLMRTNLASALGKMLSITLSAAMNVLVAFALIAVADYAYQWWKFEKDLRMTKQEVKDEYKQIEGNPTTKNRIRQKQRQMSMMRMMQAVPNADVVITNPTHYAVALRYKDGEDDAPVMLAKGQDYTARRIREIAREHDIEIVEDKPLAQALYKECEIGQAIPAAMYRAVAEILAAIYRAKQRMAGGAR